MKKVYRDTIGFEDKYIFGTELEFTNINIGYLYKIMKDDFDVKFCLQHKMKEFDFNKNWCLDVDPTVTKITESKDGKRYMGGELSSRIFIDDESTWKEIKSICNFLRENECMIDENCSNHIHVDMNNFYDNRLFYEVLSKLIAVYENDLRLFYMGDKYLKRNKIDTYAIPMKRDLLRIVNDIDFRNDPDYLYKLFYSKNNNSLLYNIDKGIYISDTDKEMEVRYPNGSLSEVTIQNNINFTLKLIDAIINDKFDKDKLTYLVKCYRNAIFNYEFFIKYNYSGFERIVDIISSDSLDKENFMCQYEKVLSTK